MSEGAKMRVESAGIAVPRHILGTPLLTLTLTI